MPTNEYNKMLRRRLILEPAQSGYDGKGKPEYDFAVVRDQSGYPLAMVHIDVFYVNRTDVGDKRIHEALRNGLTLTVDCRIVLTLETERALVLAAAAAAAAQSYADPTENPKPPVP